MPSDFNTLPQAGVNPAADLQLTSMFAARTLQECKEVLSEIKALLAESLKLSLIPRIREESKKERKEGRVFVDATDFGAAPAEQQTPARAAADPVAHSLEAPLAPSASPLAANTVAAPPAAATDATQAPLPLHRTDPTPQPAQAPSAEARSRTDRGVRLPPDWAPTADHIARARQHGFGPAQVATIAENFRDYWIAKPGAAGRKCDWDATFRVWLNREAERGCRRHVHQQKPKPGDWLLNRFYGDSEPGAETNAEPFFDVAAYAEDIR